MKKLLFSLILVGILAVSGFSGQSADVASDMGGIADSIQLTDSPHLFYSDMGGIAD